MQEQTETRGNNTKVEYTEVKYTKAQIKQEIGRASCRERV